MKKVFGIISILLTLVACTKDNGSDPDRLYQTWEAKTFMSVESVAYPKTEGKRILLTFNQSGTFSLNLDVNGCGGNFSITKSDQILMESPICTEICCDSKFSEKLAMMLPKVTSYEIEGKTLKLNVSGWGYIKLALSE